MLNKPHRVRQQLSVTHTWPASVVTLTAGDGADAAARRTEATPVLVRTSGNSEQTADDGHSSV
eukprot:93990-Pelagomonas_calceolata.AAC.1